MYKNLKIEMIRQNVFLNDISKVLGIKKETARKKLRGDIGISLPQCEKVAGLFKENNSLDYLFKTGKRD